MTYSSYSIKVPGKLMIAGEYAVLEPNQPAVVMAVNRYMNAYIEPSKVNELSLPQFGINGLTWQINRKGAQLSKNHHKLNFIKNSIEVVSQYLSENREEIPPFQLTIKSELDDPRTGRKYGLGSSAAVVVAVISAMLSFCGKNPLLDTVFKLSAIAHLKTQKSGSGADIAASVFGGIVAYSTFHVDWVLGELEKGVNLSDLIEKQWPDLSIVPLTLPSELNLCVGWTREEASTSDMIKKFHLFRVKNPIAYAEFLAESAIAVIHLIKAFADHDRDAAIASLSENRKVLLNLSNRTGMSIETEDLKNLCSTAETRGSGKPSGAGGGDCGIAFVNGEDNVEVLYKIWEGIGINPLKLTISQTGATFIEYNCEHSLKEYVKNNFR